jgi:putative transposase
MWLYLHFTLSHRDVEELLAERGFDISYETVRRWVLKVGPESAREVRARARNGFSARWSWRSAEGAAGCDMRPIVKVRSWTR